MILLGLLAGASVEAGMLARFATPLGTLDVELYDRDKPVTVNNFLRYVETGAYTNMFFHRCIPNFVIQGGGFQVVDPTLNQLMTTVYQIQPFGNITNEFNAGTKFSNTFGTLAMAKLGGDPNSASSQWFFNLGDNSTNLDLQNGGFTVFGHVVGGASVLTSINNLTPNGGGIINLSGYFGAVFSDFPVTYTGLVYPRYPDLMYAEITLLQAHITANADGTRDISWNSVANRANRVEFTPGFPAQWQTLGSLLGTGNTLHLTDPQTTEKQRFYRVSVVY